MWPIGYVLASAVHVVRFRSTRMLDAAPAHWIVIPCYNEAHRLPIDTIRNWLTRQHDFGFILVNDGSTDGTSKCLHDLADSIGNRCVAYDLDQNRGKAEAVRRGLLLALERGAQTIGYFDADLATPLEELPRLLGALQSAGTDLVLGARVQLLGRDIRRRAVRHYLGRVFATAASLTLGLAVYDTQCGAKLIRVDTWTRGLIDQPFLSRWVFDVELIARYIEARGVPRWPTGQCGIVEVPLLTWHDIGDSKVRLRDFIRAAIDLLAIWNRHTRRRISVP